MNAYAQKLKEYLESPDRSQKDLADKVGISQPSVARYASGERFPEAELARKIDAATSGEVPFALWQETAMVRIGIKSHPEAA